LNSQLFLAFLVVAAALACTPGVDWAYSIAAGLKQRSFVPAVAGLCGGYVLHTVLMVAGLAALLAGLPGVLGWLTVAGAAYLLWLGFGTIRSWRGATFGAAPVSAEGTTAGSPASIPAAPAESTQFRSFLQGMGTSGINPKGLLFFVALVPQFVSPEAALPVPVQSGLLGLTFVLLAGVVYTCVALLSRKLLHTRPGAARKVTLASGIIMMALGTVLLSEQLIPMVAGPAWQ
jgi:threonine/homoserine/homoserine lactone efflux protein